MKLKDLILHLQVQAKKNGFRDSEVIICDTGLCDPVLKIMAHPENPDDRTLNPEITVGGGMFE